MRFRSVLVVLPVLVLLAGCAPEPLPNPSPTATLVSPAPTASPTASETSAPPQAGSEFTPAGLIDLCAEKTRSLAAGATYFADMATTEWLGERSLWFVVIPKTLDGQDSVAVCAIGGTPEAPAFELEGESLPGGVAEIRDELLSGSQDSDS